MAQQVIFVGSEPNDRTGDAVRLFCGKINDNFTELYATHTLLVVTAATNIDDMRTKLAGIEDGASADMSAAEIKAAYESNANTNAFTDALNAKLAGIETGADVTDQANVNAALATALGTVTTGVWQATPVSVAKGGLGNDLSAWSNSLVKLNAAVASPVPVTAFAETLLDDADAASARTTLGIGGSSTGSLTTIDVSDMFGPSYPGAAYGASGNPTQNVLALKAAIAKNFEDNGYRGAYVYISDLLLINSQIENTYATKRITLTLDGSGKRGHLRMDPSAAGTPSVFRFPTSTTTYYTGIPSDIIHAAGGGRCTFCMIRDMMLSSDVGHVIEVLTGYRHMYIHVENCTIECHSIDHAGLYMRNAYDGQIVDVCFMDCYGVAIDCQASNNIDFRDPNVVGTGRQLQGIATGGTTTTIVLAGDAPTTSGLYNGMMLHVERGATEQKALCVGYDGPTRTCTVAAWPTFTPQSGDSYSIYHTDLTKPAMILNGSALRCFGGHFEQNAVDHIYVTGTNGARISGYFEDPHMSASHIYESSCPGIRNNGYNTIIEDMTYPPGDTFLTHAALVVNESPLALASVIESHDRGRPFDLRAVAAYNAASYTKKAYWSLETLHAEDLDINVSAGYVKVAGGSNQALFKNVGGTDYRPLIMIRNVAGAYTASRTIYPFDNAAGFVGFFIPEGATLLARVRYSTDSGSYFYGRRQNLNNHVLQVLFYDSLNDYHIRKWAHAYCDGVHEILAIGQMAKPAGNTIAASDFYLITCYSENASSPEVNITIHALEFAICFDTAV